MKCPACKILMLPSEDRRRFEFLSCGRVITLRDAARTSLFPVQAQKRLGWTENVQDQPPDLLGDSSLAWGGHRVRFAYADPPYIGQARKHYGPDAKEVNHALLIDHLNEFDAWALSLSTPSLHAILPLCPADVRICGWFKPFASFKPGVNPGFCWEPVIVRGGRKLGRDVPTVRDYHSANITLKRGTHGAKPESFCVWLFEFVGLRPRDEFTDLFPGSNAVTFAWQTWRNRKLEGAA